MKTAYHLKLATILSRMMTALSAVLLFPLATCHAAATQVDVLVIGGGASGTTAAIQAARMGSKTLLLEETGWLGGMLTSAGVSAIDGNHRLPAGLWGEFREKLRTYYGSAEVLDSGWVSHTLFEPAEANAILQDMLKREKNAKVWFQSSFTSIKKQKNGWEVSVSRNGKKELVSAKVLIDGTELGDVAKACGVKYDIGMEARAESGEAIAPEKANDIIQDLTYVAVLKDYGKGADKTIIKPEGYDPAPFYCSCQYAKCVNPKEAKRLVKCDEMLTYGKLPNDKYMINWPIEGNDYYVNLIESKPAERAKALADAKRFTLGFVYYIQTELGFKNLGLADDEFPTADKLPFIPYHRESRRIHGLVRFNVNHIADPYSQPEKLYRTGIAVGNYPVDHHHARYHAWEKLPDLHFYPVPSYALPMGVMLPQGVENLLVAEKSISVSNLANGTTRLQPVVLQIGQAAGTIAALAVKERKDVSKVTVREAQNALLAAKGYIMPYLDVPVGDPLFLPLQHIGATGILKGVGKNVAWSNETWLRADDPLLGNELSGLRDIYPAVNVQLSASTMTVREAVDVIAEIAQSEHIALPGGTDEAAKNVFSRFGIKDFTPQRPILRKEMAILLDQLLDPFNRKPVDIHGNFIPAAN